MMSCMSSLASPSGRPTSPLPRIPRVTTPSKSSRTIRRMPSRQWALIASRLRRKLHSPVPPYGSWPGVVMLPLASRTARHGVAVPLLDAAHHRRLVRRSHHHAVALRGRVVLRVVLGERAPPHGGPQVVGLETEHDLEDLGEEVLVEATREPRGLAG